ncbi:MAG TPA: MtnX-like HAD-IB family phosphatase [Candidatus Omnitrophota bacterium]|nr:MtnX-like HAD-IB family phosphatase [Candidatus Omnitrophota bacterium]HPT06840.1 MtnX-like HAD-IB family phosphatase [Candidatus Omnitrophota bacterium]
MHTIDQPAHYQVFFDFDNTITQFDILDDLIERFSISHDWVQLESEWKKGMIGSQQCLKGQLALVRITKKKLVSYLKNVGIDPWFTKIVLLLGRHGVKPIILSDDFGFIIRTVLKNHGIKGVKIICNSLKFSGDKLQLQFPHRDTTCGNCGHCKKKSLKKSLKKNTISIYIGDGRSDFCPARLTDFVFAKGSLLQHFRDSKRTCIPMNTLRDVYLFLEEKLHES